MPGRFWLTEHPVQRQPTVGYPGNSSGPGGLQPPGRPGSTRLSGYFGPPIGPPMFTSVHSQHLARLMHHVDVCGDYGKQ